MIKYEDMCVGCETCMGSGCKYYEKIPVHYCDECGEELGDIYDVDGDELCEYCLLKKFKRR